MRIEALNKNKAIKASSEFLLGRSKFKDLRILEELTEEFDPGSD